MWLEMSGNRVGGNLSPRELIGVTAAVPLICLLCSGLCLPWWHLRGSKFSLKMHLLVHASQQTCCCSAMCA